MPTISRPPRPTRSVVGDHADAARALGVPDREILAVADHPLGQLATTHDGLTYLITDEGRCDGAGQTGVLLYTLPLGRKPPSSAAVFVDPDGPAPIEQGEPWTLADLDAEADRLTVPPARPGADPYGAWLAVDDPVLRAIRAYALLRRTAAGNNVTLEEAGRRFGACRAWRQFVLDADLLQPEEAARL